jgi:RNA polymerase sigma-70 factor (ECF subfamily)
VSPFASELRACLSELLRGPVPEAAGEDDPVRFFRQWLAERNLGLVPIADAAGFSWPGRWIARVRGGDGGAYEELYRRHADAVRRYARSCCRDAHTAEDLTGEVFLQVVRDLRGFEGGEREFRAWIFTIAHHRLLDDLRRRGRRPAEAYGRYAGEGHAVANAEQEALDSMGAERVRRIIAGLSPDQRDVLLLRVLGGLTVVETAAALGKTAGAVKALQRRGLLSVQEALAAERVTL